MKHYICLLLLFIFIGTQAQRNFDTQFLNHLVSKGDYHEALYLINQNSFRNDSIYFYEGWSHYVLKELKKSTDALLNVSTSSTFYDQSQLFAAYNLIYLSNYQQSSSILTALHSNQTAIISLRDFQLSGIFLLKKQFGLAENTWEELDKNNPVLYQPLIDLQNISNELQSHKTKSPVIAGLLSAIVPGAGKIYAGKTGQGIAAFISAVGFGLITWENYRKLGPTHYKTIGFGALFATNYLSTVYGSYATTKIIENEYQTVMQNQILFNLHLPLRNFFE